MAVTVDRYFNYYVYERSVMDDTLTQIATCIRSDRQLLEEDITNEQKDKLKRNYKTLEKRLKEVRMPRKTNKWFLGGGVISIGLIIWAIIKSGIIMQYQSVIELPKVEAKADKALEVGLKNGKDIVQIKERIDNKFEAVNEKIDDVKREQRIMKKEIIDVIREEANK